MNWISVKDRLPERDGESKYVECIVTIWFYGTDMFDEPCEHCQVTVAQFDTAQKIWLMANNASAKCLNACIELEDLPSTCSYISHWMPLPETPKEESK